MTYKLLIGRTAESLEKKVNEALVKGGELVGSPSVQELKGGIYLIQAVIFGEE